MLVSIVADVTNSVGNIAHTHFAANVFSLPLKTEANPRGIYSEHELYMVLAIIFVCIFFDLDPAKSFPLRRTAYVVTQQIGKLVEANLKAVKATGWIAGIVNGMQENPGPLRDYGVHMIRRLLESGMNLSEIAWSHVLPTAVAMVANQAQVVGSLLQRLLSRDVRRANGILFSSLKPWTSICPTLARFIYPSSTDLPRWTPRRPMRGFYTTAWKAFA